MLGKANVVGLPPFPFLEAWRPAGLLASSAHVLATTVFLVGVVLAQMGNAFACRSENGGHALPSALANPTLILGTLVEVALILALVYVPTLRGLFRLAELPPTFLIGLATYGPILYLLERLRKWVARTLRQPRLSRRTGGVPS
jgi:Ca2+-transporting ATPase